MLAFFSKGPDRKYFKVVGYIESFLHNVHLCLKKITQQNKPPTLLKHINYKLNF